MEAIAIIERSMGPAALVVMRLGGLFIYAPLISMKAIPTRIKGLLVLVTGVGAWAVGSRPTPGPLPPGRQPLNLQKTIGNIKNLVKWRKIG